jgi:CBS domain-containing protein
LICIKNALVRFAIKKQRRGTMKARDVMVSPVITVKSSALVQDVAKTFLERRISAVPVVDDQGKLIGIVSEGDLLHRSEAGTERRRSWWLRALTEDEALAAEYTKAHARKVGDVMTRQPITASPDTPLHEIAALLERNSIKRVPIVDKGQLVGIVSRANLIQAVASARKELEIPLSDTTIRDKILSHLKQQTWAHTGLLNVTVNDGVVNLWGMTDSDSERKAIRVAAETMPGVRVVNDHLFTRPRGLGS